MNTGVTNADYIRHALPACGGGGAGAEALAHTVINATAQPTPSVRYLYDLKSPPETKITAVARTIYGADSIEFSRTARKDLKRISTLGYDRLPVCIAKTHLSLSGDPALRAIRGDLRSRLNRCALPLEWLPAGADRRYRYHARITA
ncbi:MAG: formate--tetrahydrofolate ligase [Nitrosomonas sp.]|nr:formate--tetrahydrofolate ligase [Nitrosomonas sp.]